MISNKTVVILFLIALAMKVDASSSKRAKKLPKKSVLKRRRGHASNPKKNSLVLEDATNNVGDVEARGEDTSTMSISQDQPVSQVNKFKKLIKQKNYKEIFEIGMKMKPDEFMIQLSSVVKSAEQYKGLTSHLKKHKMVARFYLYGDVNVLKKALIKSRVYDGEDYAENGDLETALPLAFKEDHHDRIIDLLKIRQEITAVNDKENNRQKMTTSFEKFVKRFFEDLAVWKDDKPLRHFLASRGEELRKKHSDVLDIFCQQLIPHLNCRLDEPSANMLLTDLIGQPLLLAPLAFAKGFFHSIHIAFRPNFVEYAWDDAIGEGLTNEDLDGDEVWQTMTEIGSEQFYGPFPSTPVALAAVLAHFPSKQKLEEDWHGESVAILFDKVKSFESIISLPDALWSIIFEYVISLTFIRDPAKIEPRRKIQDLAEQMYLQKILMTMGPLGLAREAMEMQESLSRIFLSSDAESLSLFTSKI